MSSQSDPQPTQFECRADEGFSHWLAASGGALAVSTYQAGRLLMIGWLGDRLSLLPRQFEKAMGFDLKDGQLALAGRRDITLFHNCPVLARHYKHDQPGRYDALWLPRTVYRTGELHAHDVSFAGDGTLWFVNTRFSCLATVSDRFNFKPLWRPAFVSDYAAEDRCHLNGLCMKDGEPAYVTALGTTDRAGGWRDNKATGGVVIDVKTNDIVLDGLAMPHSPRWHDGKLWLVNSGAGQLLCVDPASGQAEVVAEFPGYLRGLTFVGSTALVGLCKAREDKIFGGMPIDARRDELRCGVALLDLATRRQTGFFEFIDGCTELYDLRFLPGIRRPNILAVGAEASEQAMTGEPDVYYWLRPQNEIHDNGSDASAR